MLLQRFLHNGNTAPTLSQTTDYRQRRVLYSLYLSIPFDDNGQWTTDYGVLYSLSLSTTTDYGVLYSSILSILFYTFYTLYTFRGQRTRGGVQYFLNIVVILRATVSYGVKPYFETVSLYLFKFENQHIEE